MDLSLEEQSMLQWLRSAIRLPGFTPEKWKEHDGEALTFLSNPESKLLVAYTTTEGDFVLLCPYSLLPVSPRTFQYFIKRDMPGEEGGKSEEGGVQPPLTMSTLRSRLQMGFVNGGGVDSLMRLMSSVFMPSLRVGGGAGGGGTGGRVTAVVPAPDGPASLWPVSVRRDFLGQAQKFMASLVETHHQVQGATVLYVSPDEDLTAGVEDKELIQRLEASLIHWTRQIKEAVSQADSASAGSSQESGGPLDELAYYTSRCDNLSGATAQLQSPRLQQILSLLREAGSAYLPPFLALSHSIRQSFEESSDNVKFLAILKPMCDTLASATPSTLPTILPELLSRVRVIGSISRHYCTPERLTSLCRRVSNEVLRRCAAAVDVREVFEGDPGVAMGVISQCVACLTSWRALFFDTVEAVTASSIGKSPRGQAWAALDTGSIFAQVEAFSQRCNDLVAVCRAQVQYARKSGVNQVALPPVGGLKGMEIQGQLVTVERTFSGHVASLKSLETCALDVKALSWGEAQARVRSGIKDLENMYGGIISEAFMEINSVSPAVALLEVFSSLAKSPAVLRAVEVKAGEVLTLFSKVLAEGKSYFEANAASPPLTDGSSRFCGAALWSRGLQGRMAADWRLVKGALAYLPPMGKLGEEVVEAWGKLDAGLEEYQRGRYTDWVHSLQDLDYAKVTALLATPLLSRCGAIDAGGRGVERPGGEKKGGKAGAKVVTLLSSPTLAPPLPYLRSNFPKRIADILRECEVWEGFGGKFEVPRWAMELLGGSAGENLRQIRGAVLLATGDYNTLVSSMDEVEGKLLADIVRRLDRKLQPGLTTSKVTWLLKSVKDGFLTDMRRSVSEVWAVLLEFKVQRERVVDLVTSFSSLSLLHLDRNCVHDEGVFEARQVEHRIKVKGQLEKLHGDVASLLAKCYSVFAGEGVGVQRAWARWVRSMDVRVEASLKILVTSSLDVLKRAICTVVPSGGGEGKGGHRGHYEGGGMGATFAASASFSGSSTARGGGLGVVGGGGSTLSAILPSGEEVRPVFRVYFTLDGSTIAPRPTMDTLTAMLIRECQEVIACVTVVPRLEDVLPLVVKKYSATAESIRVMAGKAAAAAQLGPANRRLGAAVAALEEEDFPVMETGGKATFPSLPSFHTLISATPILSEVATAIEESVAELGARTESKERGELQSRASKLTLDRAIELQRFERVHYNQPLGLATIKQYLDEFMGIEVEMREALMEEESGFLLVDRSRIKAEFAALCQEWRRAYVSMVQRKSGKEVSSLLDRMEESRRLISVQATNLDDLRRNLKIIQDTKMEVQSVFHDRFTHLETAYALISSFEATLDDAELTRLASLRPTFELFVQELEVGEENIKRSKDAMRSETVAGLSGFSALVDDLQASCVDPSEGLPYTFEPTVLEAKERLGAWGARLAGLRVKEKALEPAIEVFELPSPDYSILGTLEEDLKGLEVMWALVEGWEMDWGSWKTGSFSKLDVPGMEESAGKTRAKLVKLREYKKWKVWGGLESKVKDFLLLTPLIQSLSNPAMRPRHWEQLVKEVGVVFDPTSEDFSLEKMFDMGLSRYADFISDLSNAANKELAIEEALKDISKAWSTLDLDIVEYKGVYFKLRSTEDLYQTMEDHAVSVSAMKASPSAAVFGEELERWEKTLSLISEVVDMQLQVQKKWMYLESIFMASEDIRKMLPAEAGWFEEVNATFNRIMGRCAANRNALAACTVPGFLEEQEVMDATLERIQKALDSYLELKRQQFPRFYFLSNDDLLEILGQSKDPMQVQKHIKKCFEGIQSLHINEPGTAGNACHEAVGMTAPDGERVPFERKVMVKGAVEMWLIEVERAMIFGLAKLVGIEEWVGTKEGCFFKAKKNKADPEKLKWIKEFPGQLLITAGMMHFVKNCEDALRHKESPGKQLKKRKRWQVELLTKLAEIVRDKLDKVSRKKVVALITMEIHARDVMERMIKARCSGLEDFEWLSQLRLEPVTVRNENHPYGTIAAKQTKSTLEFGFEYQGNNGRLVVTPLTDRCVLTLTTALYMQRGGAPAGPAGTGKTETVKDLGKNLAKFVVVFNCSDGLDYKSVGRMFSGLVQSGGWGCFDEFNRIEVEVLSVIAQQVLSVMEAIRSRKHTFDFMGLRIKCNWQCGIFITMNPGYAGRSELPDNLKSLFRPVAMMVPDLALIAEVMLQSEGFENSRVLAKKTVTLYSLMIQQLSKQDHYDYSLRSLRGVLVCAGALKRSPIPPSGAPTDPKLLEDFIVLRAIRDMNLPKFIKVDADLFRLLLKDLFPALELPAFDPGDLGAAIAAELDKAGLQQNPTILQKCIELRDSKVTRHCNMLVGKTLAGKSTTWRMLAAACTQLAGAKVEGFLKVRVESINPKSIEMKELYGAYDLQTMEWQDGILSSVFREYARDDRNEEKWLMLDGPVDTLWIESMNTVMDDNKVLTLINGDRIGMTETMSLLFECQDLSVASPATVSRAGMVYIDEADLGWGPFVSSWTSRVFKGQGAPFIEFMGSLFQKYCPRLLRFKRRECKELIPLGDFHAVLSLCNLLDALWAIPENALKGGGGGGVEDKAFLAYVERWFAFACVWSLGGCVDEAGRKKFNEGMREFEGLFPPGASTVYDFSVDPVSKDFKHWSDRLNSSWRPPRDLPLSKIIVPTIDTVRNTFVMAALVSKGYHFLSIGNTGTGKSALSQVHLEGMSSESFSKSVMYFSAATSSTAVQEIIEGCLEKKSKNKMGPPAGKRLLLLVDDLNMPKKDTFGSQPPLELLRQWLDYGGWYDRGKQAWRYIVDMQLMSAMGPPGGGRTQISERLQSRFSMVNFTFPAEKETKKIFETILVSRLGDFGEEVLRLVPGVVAATLKVYEGTVESFLPTPACSHYLFNLRDIANVMKGLLSLNARNVESKDAFLLAWSHECTRVFADRFVNGEDFKKFFNILDVSLHKATEVYVKSLWEGCENPTLGPIFLSFVGNDAPLVPAEGGEERPPYKELRGSVDALRGAVEEDMMEYNSTPGYLPLNLVFFKDALRHVARIHRMLRSPRGNALLVGVGGSGRQSLTRVAAFLTKDSQGNRMGVFSIEITKLYRKLEFHEDLKRLYNRTGVEGRPTCFLFSDTQIKEEGFLEDINNILNSGEVPNLFTKDERGAVIDTMRPLAKKLGMVMPGGGTGDELWSFFIQRVRENLHLVLAMSPVGDAFRNRCRMYPSLVNCTTIDWFLEWPSDALREVATKFLDDVRLAPPKVVVGGGGDVAATGAPFTSNSSSTPSVDPELALKGQIATVFAELHLSVIVSSRRMLLQLKRYNYVTPTNYLELVKGYRELVTSKLKELGDQRDKLSNGLSKLESSKVQVEEMQVTLAEKQKVVEKSSADCDALLVKIVQEKRVADEQKAEVEETSARIDVEAAKCKAIADDANADLAEALPALEAAMAAVDRLDKASITEVKSFANPPEPVKLCLEAVCILFKRPPTWDEAKKKMNESDFLQQVKNFDKDNVDPGVLKRLRKYTEMRVGVGGAKIDFTSDFINSKSSAAGALATWCLAVEKYSEVAKTVAPKKAILHAAEKALEEKMAALTKAKLQLAEVVAKVEALNAKHIESVTEKTRLTLEAATLQDKLERAENLIGGLSGERVRWEASIQRYESLLRNAPGDALIAAGFLSYAGPFDAVYRGDLVAGWLGCVKSNGVPASDDFNFATFLADPSDVRDWNIQGLPSDQFSTENGVIVTRGRRWPLMVDPQGQANKWVKEKEKKRGIKVTDLKAKDFLRELEGAITYGLPYLLQDVEEDLDPALEPVLTKSVVKRGTREVLKLGDKELDFNPAFKLYVTTKLANPHYTPEVSTKVTIVNFAVKEQGLEAQLLGAVVREEQPILEQEKSRLVVSVAAGKRKLQELENTILRLLSEVQGSLLDDKDIVVVLQASKTTSEEVTASLEVSEATEKKIDAAREGYRPVATRASLLYFVLNDLALVDSMYQFSLDAYNLLFLQSIQESRRLAKKTGTEAFDDEEGGAEMLHRRRIADINEHHTLEVYKYACRGLFERHKLLLSFQVCVRMQQVEGGGGKVGGGGGVDASIYDWFLKGAAVLDRTGQRHNPAPSWITPTTWDAITDLEKLDPFVGLAGGVESYVAEWGAWFYSPTPERMPLPGEWEGKCDDLMRLTLVRAIRSDRVLSAVARYVSSNLGPAFVEPPPFDLKAIYESSTNVTPLVFILSPGVDPTTEVLQLSAAQGVNLEYCSLGQGQAPIAERMLTDALKKGGWVFLQNCHLSISWMPTLEKLIDALCEAASKGGANAPHKNFRLWLSSSPHPAFPIAILQRAIKLTTEPPRGIRANIIRLYNLLDPTEFAARSAAAPGTYAKLLFSLSWFHALLLERKKFKSLGWCIAYDFNNSDYLLAADILNDYLAVPTHVKGGGGGADPAAAAAALLRVPWDAIRYLIAEVTYGGRVTDDYDRRLVSTYTSQYFCEEVVTTPYYKLSSLPDYYIPDDGSVANYKDFVNQMASADPPEAFGQHPNADIQSAILDTADLLGTVLSLQPRAIAGEGARPEDKVAALCVDLEKQLPDLFDVEMVRTNVAPRGDPEPLKVVLYQECERYNKLLSAMKRTLSALRKGIAGTVVITSELEQLFDALLVGRVPGAWGFAYPSLKPLGLWVRDLLDRLKQLNQWVTKGMPGCFWLSGFTYPTGFLTAMLQTSARANGLAIDNLEFEYPIVLHSPDHLKEGPAEGQYIKGLFLEGAQWSKEDACLCEPEPMQLFAPMPVVHFKPIEARRERTRGIYKCPMYLYPVRTGTRERPSYMGVVDLRCAEGVEPSTWIKRGTAILLALGS